MKLWLILIFAKNIQGMNFPLRAIEENGIMVIGDASKKRVKLTCVNWAGGHMEEMVPNGLDKQPLDEITSHISDMGFNCVRLNYALDTLYKNPVVPDVRLSQNPELKGLRSMGVLDKVIDSLSAKKIMVILANIVSKF